jgi:hypothetical protein
MKTSTPDFHAAQLVPAGQLYISGHAGKRGYAIERRWSDAECAAVAPGLLEAASARGPRFVRERRRATRLVERWNRRFASS